MRAGTLFLIGLIGFSALAGALLASLAGGGLRYNPRPWCCRHGRAANRPDPYDAESR